MSPDFFLDDVLDEANVEKLIALSNSPGMSLSNDDEILPRVLLTKPPLTEAIESLANVVRSRLSREGYEPFPSLNTDPVDSLEELRGKWVLFPWKGKTFFGKVFVLSALSRTINVTDETDPFKISYPIRLEDLRRSNPSLMERI